MRSGSNLANTIRLPYAGPILVRRRTSIRPTSRVCLKCDNSNLCGTILSGRVGDDCTVEEDCSSVVYNSTCDVTSPSNSTCEHPVCDVTTCACVMGFISGHNGSTCTLREFVSLELDLGPIQIRILKLRLAEMYPN